MELPTEVVGSDSDRNLSAYEWIKAREERGNVIEQWEQHFPDGPREPLGTWVNIVVVIDEGAYRRA